MIRVLADRRPAPAARAVGQARRLRRRRVRRLAGRQPSSPSSSARRCSAATTSDARDHAPGRAAVGRRCRAVRDRGRHDRSGARALLRNTAAAHLGLRRRRSSCIPPLTALLPSSISDHFDAVPALQRRRGALRRRTDGVQRPVALGRLRRRSAATRRSSSPPPRGGCGAATPDAMPSDAALATLDDLAYRTAARRVSDVLAVLRGDGLRDALRPTARNVHPSRAAGRRRWRWRRGAAARAAARGRSPVFGWSWSPARPPRSGRAATLVNGAGAAGRALHRGRAAAAPGGAGLRAARSLVVGRRAAAVGVAGGSWWYAGDLRLRAGRRRASALGLYVRHPAGLPRRAAATAPHGLERERDQQVELAAAGRAGQDRARDARHRGPPPDRDGRAERGGRRRRVPSSPRAAAEAHAQRVGHRAAGAGRYPPAPRRAARGPAPAALGTPAPGLGQLDELVDQVRAAGLATCAGDQRADRRPARRACS